MPHFHTYEFEELGSELDSLILSDLGQNGEKVSTYVVSKNLSSRSHSLCAQIHTNKHKDEDIKDNFSQGFSTQQV